MSGFSGDGTGGAGRGRPPAHSRFKPGQSGNPRGRPKGSKNLRTLILAELNETVVVTENGSRRKLSVAQIIAKRIVKKAASADGDLRVQLALLKLESEAQAAPAASVSRNALGTKDDEELVQLFLDSMKDDSDGRT